MAQLVGRHATPPTSLRGSLSLEALDHGKYVSLKHSYCHSEIMTHDDIYIYIYIYIIIYYIYTHRHTIAIIARFSDAPLNLLRCPITSAPLQAGMYVRAVNI